MDTEIFTYIDPSPPPVSKEGSLTGKSVSIQPNMSVQGWPTEAGSVALERFVAVQDATVVERLRSAGAAIIGSTRMSELGFGLAGDTAAQALSEGKAEIGLITDTMGEARLAASSIGVFGFKPSYGIVSRFGLIGIVPSMECFGILAKTIEEIAEVMKVIAGRDTQDYSMPECEIPDFNHALEAQEPPGVIGVIQECFEGLECPESEAFAAEISKLQQAGLKIQELSLHDFDLFRAVHNVIGSVEASSSCGKYDGVRYGHRHAQARNWNEMYLKSRAESFGLLIKSYIFQGAYFQFENYPAFENACRIRSRLVRAAEGLFNRAEVLLLPAGGNSFDASEAGTIEEVYDAFALSLVANVTGQPSIILPGPAPDEGIKLQLIGARLNDARLLSIASQLYRLAKGQ